MSIESEPKRHHYVPQCYLRNFMIGDKLYYLNITYAKKGYNAFARKCYTSTICFETDLYRSPEETTPSIFSLSKWDKLFVETKVLNELESIYGRLFTSITSEEEISMEDAHQFCDFIIQLKMRNPYYARSAYSLKKAEDTLDILLKTTEGENAALAHLPVDLKKEVAMSSSKDLRTIQTWRRNCTSQV